MNQPAPVGAPDSLPAGGGDGQRREAGATAAPTHIALDLRLTAGEADALEAGLAKLRAMAERGVLSLPAEERDDLLRGLGRVIGQLRARAEPLEG